MTKEQIALAKTLDLDVLLAAAAFKLGLTEHDINAASDSKRLPADLVEEIREFLEDYSDVVDGQDGPRPNKAMALLSRIEEETREDIRRPQNER